MQWNETNAEKERIEERKRCNNVKQAKDIIVNREKSTKFKGDSR